MSWFTWTRSFFTPRLVGCYVVLPCLNINNYDFLKSWLCVERLPLLFVMLCYCRKNYWSAGTQHCRSEWLQLRLSRKQEQCRFFCSFVCLSNALRPSACRNRRTCLEFLWTNGKFHGRNFFHCVWCYVSVQSIDVSNTTEILYKLTFGQIRLDPDYPCPLISYRNRRTVYEEVGHTMMNLLCDFRNFQYHLPCVEDAECVMEKRSVIARFPKHKYDQVGPHFCCCGLLGKL